MVTALTWDSYLDAMSRLAVVEPDNVDFLALAPQMVNYAELRLQRDLDFLIANSQYNLSVFAPGSRALSWPDGTFVTLLTVEAVTPASVPPNSPNLGTRHMLKATTREFITTVYPDTSSAGLPKYFYPGQNGILVGPFPDQAYTSVVFGTIRLPTLSATNPTTFIATHLPDLFIMASMVWISGYQRNFGRQSDDPQQAVSYEQQYMTLLKSAFVEEARKKFQAAAWSPYAPAPVATPSRQATGAPG